MLCWRLVHTSAQKSRAPLIHRERQAQNTRALRRTRPCLSQHKPKSFPSEFSYSVEDKHCKFLKLTQQHSAWRIHQAASPCFFLKKNVVKLKSLPLLYSPLFLINITVYCNNLVVSREPCRPESNIRQELKMARSESYADWTWAGKTKKKLATVTVTWGSCSGSQLPRHYRIQTLEHFRFQIWDATWVKPTQTF